MVFERLEANYVELASHATIMPAREHELAAACDRLLRDKPVYQHVQGLTGVPIAALMALAEREMAGSLHCYLGNGQRLTKRTTIVPKNRGPFGDTPDGFVAGCLDALRLDGLDTVYKQKGGWSLARFCYESEAWNGWGYRARGIPSPYVFGATSVQKPGKFPRDHYFDPKLMDPQLGTLALVEELVKQDPALAFYEAVARVDSSAIAPAVDPHPVITANAAWVQSMLNKLHAKGTPLLVDGNIGRGSRAAVREFQRTHRLYVDGLPGPKTVAAINEALAMAGLA